MKIYRQGDLLLEEVKSLPKNKKQKQNNVLLTGEITGHAHKIGEGAKVFTSGKTIFMAVYVPTAPLTHEEHETIEIPKGNYKLTRQREFDPYRGIRNVTD